MYRIALALGHASRTGLRYRLVARQRVVGMYADLIGAYTSIFGVLGETVALLVWYQVTAHGVY